MGWLKQIPIGLAYAAAMGACGNVLIGIGDVLMELANGVNSTSVSSELMYLFLVRGLGQLIATPLAAYLFKEFYGHSIIIYCLAMITALWASASFISDTYLLYAWFFATGLLTATIDTGTQILTRRAYGTRAGPWLTANTMVFASAGLVSPLVDYVTNSTQQQTFIYAGFATFVVLLFLLIGDEVYLLPKLRDQVRRTSRNYHEDFISWFSSEFKMEWMMALMVFFAIGGQNVFSSYVISFVNATGYSDKIGSAVLSTFWASTVLARICAIWVQQQIRLSSLMNALLVLLILCIIAALPLFGATSDYAPSGTIWLSTILYGAFTGPLLGFIFDMQNRVCLEAEKGSAILIFGMNMGTSLVPWALVALWNTGLEYTSFPAVLLLAPLVAMLILGYLSSSLVKEQPEILMDDESIIGQLYYSRFWQWVNRNFHTAILVLYFVLVTVFLCISSSFPAMYAIQFPGACNQWWHFCTDWDSNLHVLYFFGFLYVIGIWGALRTNSKAFRNFTEEAISIGCGKLTTLRDVFLVCSVIILTLCWWTYWYSHVDYSSNAERFIKTVGHLMDLIISLLVLLTARTSIFDNLLGMTYEQGISYHTWLGTLAFILITIHFCGWQIYWSDNGDWLEEAILRRNDPNVNLVTGEACSVWQTLRASCGNGHFWAVPAMELWYMLLGIPALGLLAWAPVRRVYYQLFYYAHHHILIFFPLAYYHSWNLWKYSTIGLVLWVISRLASRYRASLKVKVLSLKPYQSYVTEIHLERADGEHLHKQRPGMFVYLNIPEIDPWEWHPFSISSAPQYGAHLTSWTHHIKAVSGANMVQRSRQWTDVLFKIASLSYKGTSELEVYFDGPYGQQVFQWHNDVDDVIFVAGGIGITNPLSYLTDLAERRTRDVNSNIDLKRAHLVWLVRDKQMIVDFHKTLQALSEFDDFIRLHIFVTGGSTAKANEETPLLAHTGVRSDTRDLKLAGIGYDLGRPDMHSTLSRIIDGDAFSPKGLQRQVGVFVCGPATLVTATEAALATYRNENSSVRIRFHAEPYAL